MEEHEYEHEHEHENVRAVSKASKALWGDGFAAACKLIM